VGFEHLSVVAPQVPSDGRPQRVLIFDNQNRVLASRHGYILVW
jgi:hypothetical protein